MSDLPLAATAALITGASSGIGEATARRLAEEGADVALIARRGDRIDRLAAELRESGVRAVAISADLTQREQAEAAVAESAATLEGLDLVVNNAGLMLLGTVEGAPPEEWERMLQINFLGLAYCAKAALPHLLEAAQGPRGVADMVNVSSVAGRLAPLGSAGYSASKHAVGAFSESLRQEVAQRQVRVSLVEPGVVETELGDHSRPEAYEGLPNRFEGVTRMQAEDIAESISFVVTRPSRVAVNELLVRPTNQVF
jgi:NADP-dependent 3-hydroxy acid dehydrogenase YdfG